MRFTLLTVAGVCGALLLGGLGCGGHNSNSVTNPNTSTFTPTGTVNGVLVDSVTAQPIAGATIAIMTQTTVTGPQGQFTLTNVPANGTAVGILTGDPGGGTSYPVVIDLTKYNAGLAAGAVKYPNYVYAAVDVTYSSLGDAQPGSSTNHATPVDGFVANMVPTVGKLDANIQILVVDGHTLAPAVGATVTLLSATNGLNLNTTINSSVGVVPNQIMSGPTDATGKVTFSNMQANESFTANATSADNNYTGTMDVVTMGDNTTKTYVTAAKLPANPEGTCLQLFALSQQSPFILSVTPASLSDIAPGATAVTYTFSEPIAKTAYSLATAPSTSVAGGLWGDVSVTYNGPKASNMGYSLSWSTDMTKLSVNFPTVAASRYTVDISTALLSLQDAFNNFGVDDLNLAVVAFTTNGGLTPQAATIVQDTNPATFTNITWLRTTNTYQYVVQVQRSLNGLVDDTGWAATSSTVIDVRTIDDTNGNLIFVPGWASGQLAYSYEVTVYSLAMATDPGNYLITGVPSNTVPLANLVPASIFGVGSVVVPDGNGVLPTDFGTLPTGTTSDGFGAAAGDVVTYQVQAQFTGVGNGGLIPAHTQTAVMFREAVENMANWTVSKAVAANPGGAWLDGVVPADDVLPVITNVTFDELNQIATVTFTTTQIAAGATWDPEHVVFGTTAVDVTGLALANPGAHFDFTLGGLTF